MLNPFIGLTDRQKKCELQELLRIRGLIVKGQRASRIDDSGVGSAYFDRGDLPKIEADIKILQAELFPTEFRKSIRRATPIYFRDC